MAGMSLKSKAESGAGEGGPEAQGATPPTNATPDVTPPDPTANSLKKILEGGDHETLNGVPIFDAHDEYDDKGKLLRKFGRPELERIAAATNAREAKTGDLALIGPGHTIDGAPETSQPPPWGYARNFRTGTFGPQNKLGLLADLIVRKDRKAEALTYPRRSIELWTRDHIVDWIALLRRTPERDLGLLAYSREHGLSVLPPAAPLFYDPTRQHQAAARLSPDGKLRYAREFNVADETNDDAFYEKFAACMSRYEAEKLKYQAAAAGPGFPGGGNVAVPTHAAAAPAPARRPPDMDEEKTRLQKEAEMIRFSRLEQQVREMEDRTIRAECETTVRELMYEGILLDPALEIDKFAKLDKAQREQHKEYLRKFNKRDPAGGPWVQVDRAPIARELSKDEQRDAIRYATHQREKGHEVSFDEALAATRTA